MTQSDNRSNQKQIIDLIERVSGNANLLVIPRALISLTGDVKAALLLSQCLYWSDKGGKGDGWFYKSRREWEEEIGLTRHEQDHAMKMIEQWVETRIKRANGAPTIHYRLKMDALEESISSLTPDLREIGKSENRTPICAIPQIEVTENGNPFAEKVQVKMTESRNSLTKTTQRSKQKFKQRTRHRLQATAIDPEKQKSFESLREVGIGLKKCKYLILLPHVTEVKVLFHIKKFRDEVLDAKQRGGKPLGVGILVRRLEDDDPITPNFKDDRKRYLDYLEE